MVSKAKCCVAGGSLLLLVGVALIVLGALVQDVVDDAITEGVKSSLKITPGDESNKGSSDWQKDYIRTDLEYTYHVFHYNNTDAFIAGTEAPRVTDFGPYFYKEFSTKYNLSFENDDTTIDFHWWWHKEVEQTRRGVASRDATVDTPTALNTLYFFAAYGSWALTKASVYKHTHLLPSLGGATCADTYPGLTAPANQGFPCGVTGAYKFVAGSFPEDDNCGEGECPTSDVLVRPRESHIGVAQGATIWQLFAAQFTAPTVAQGGLFVPAIKYIAMSSWYGTTNSAFLAAMNAGHCYDPAATLALIWTGDADANNFHDKIAACPDGVFSATPQLVALGGKTAASLSVTADVPFEICTDDSEFCEDVRKVAADLWSSAFGFGFGNPSLSQGAAYWAILAGRFPASDEDKDELNTTLHGYFASKGVTNSTRLFEGVLEWLDGFTDTPQFELYTVPGILFAYPTLAAAVASAPSPKKFVHLAYAQVASAAALNGAPALAAYNDGFDEFVGVEYSLFNAREGTSFTATWDNVKFWMDTFGATGLTKDTLGLTDSSHLFNLLYAETQLPEDDPFPLIAHRFQFALTPSLGIANWTDFADRSGIGSRAELVNWMKYATYYLPYHLFFVQMANTPAYDEGRWTKTRTVHDFLFGQYDSIYTTGYTGIITNFTDANDHYSRAQTNRYSFYTGVGDIKRARHYYAWRGVRNFTTLIQNYDSRSPSGENQGRCATAETSLCLAWVSNEEIQGSTDGKYMESLSEDKVIPINYAFVSEVQRVVRLLYAGDEGTIVFKGIKLRRYRIDPTHLVPGATNAKYWMQRDLGMLPMGHFAPKGSPTFLGKPHFLDCDANAVQAKIVGLNPDPEIHDTYIDIEPLSGATMRGYKRFQASFQVSSVARSQQSSTQALTTIGLVMDYPWSSKMFNNLTAYGSGDSAVSKEENQFYYLPWYWGVESGEIKDKDARDFREAIYDNRNMADDLAIGGLVIGIVLTLLSLLCIVHFCRKAANPTPSTEKSGEAEMNRSSSEYIPKTY